MASSTLSPEAVEWAFRYIADHLEISEVILTGGGPLVSSPQRLAEIMQRLVVSRSREDRSFHTRLPYAVRRGTILKSGKFTLV